MKTTVFILVHNRAGLLYRCLMNLNRYTQPEEIDIVVIDNGSTDEETLKYLVWLKDNNKVKVVTLDKNYNFSDAHNMAVEQVKPEDDIVLLNSDCFVFEGWLAAFKKSAQEHAGGGVFGAFLLTEGNLVNHVGVVFTDKKVPVHYLYNTWVTDPRISKVDEQFQAVTFAMAYIKKECWDAVNGLSSPQSSDFGYFYEDIDFCFKARQAGYEVWLCPEVKACHVGSGTAKTEIGFKNQEEATAFCFRHTDKFVEKWKDIIVPDKKNREILPKTPKILLCVPITEAYWWCSEMLKHSLLNLSCWKADITIFFMINNSGNRFWDELIDWGLTQAKKFGFRAIRAPRTLSFHDTKNESIVHARNMCVREVLGGDFDYLFFIDCDVLLEYDALEKLMKLDSDIATGIVLFHQKPKDKAMILKVQDRFKNDAPSDFVKRIEGLTTQYEMDEAISPDFFQKEMGEFEIDNSILEKTEAVEVAASGLGCCLIKRKVLEKLAEKEDIFVALAKGYATEDLVFFHKARNAGFKTMCDPTIRTYHLGKGVVYGR